jgi:hypothetical protein
MVMCLLMNDCPSPASVLTNSHAQGNGNKQGMWLLLITLLLPALISTRAFTQPAGKSNFIINTKRLTVKEGLAHQEVYDIIQDSRGFMWMATRSGLTGTTAIHSPLSPGKKTGCPTTALFLYITPLKRRQKNKPNCNASSH